MTRYRVVTNRVIIVCFINYDDRQFSEVNLTLGLQFATRKWLGEPIEIYNFWNF